jgi:hypothetical protein
VKNSLNYNAKAAIANLYATTIYIEKDFRVALKAIIIEKGILHRYNWKMLSDFSV